MNDMSAENNACSNHPIVRMEFTDASIYTLAPDADKSSIHDYLWTRLTHLESMLAAICGNGFKLFNNEWGDKQKEEYLWGAEALARECKELSFLLNSTVE